MSNKVRDRAIQLVVGEEPVDFAKKTQLPSAHEQEQRASANEPIVIVTHKYWSAVSCPIKVGIVPFSWLVWRYLSILQSKHGCHQHKNTNIETAQTREL